MKKFKFKLESLIKLREFKEYNIKQELGKINMEMSRIKERIQGLRNGIENCFSYQEAILTTPSNIKMIQVYAESFEGSYRAIENLKVELHGLEMKYDQKLKELVKARNEVKVIEKLRKQEMAEFKKNVDKKANDDINDLFQSQKTYKENG